MAAAGLASLDFVFGIACHAYAWRISVASGSCLKCLICEMGLLCIFRPSDPVGLWTADMITVTSVRHSSELPSSSGESPIFGVDRSVRAVPMANYRLLATPRPHSAPPVSEPFNFPRVKDTFLW
jgi:hypothetical protein